jgi:lactate permease
VQIALSCIPVAVLVIALVGLKLPAWKAALAAFAVCAVEAFALRGVGLGEIATCSLKGASTGLFPIGLIIVAALFTYAVVVESGAEEEIKSGLSSLSGDKRYLALLIAWGFGNFMEGMAGFGTAVAIPCAIMMGVGFDPLKAVLCCLVANTTPTAFASVGVPTFVLASETGLDAGRLASAIGFVQLAVAFASPFLILFITDGLRGLRERWWLALVAAASFIVPWLSLAAWAGCELPNIAGSVATLFVLALMGDHSRIDMQRQRRAWCPFAIVVAALGASAFLPARWKVSPGFVILVAAFVGGLCQGVRPARLVALAGKTALKYAPAIGTICLVLALGKTMGAAGMTQDLANGLVAATGKWYPAVSPVVGALGGFVTGSGTSSNVLFGSLQASIGTTEAEQLVFAASNIMGAGIGKVICPQSIILGCAATGLAGRESEVMKRAFRYFLFILALACASSFLMVLASKEIECVSQTGLL